MVAGGPLLALASGVYERFGFVVSPTDPLHLMRLMQDLRASLA